jgi:transposase-like protein
MTGIGKSQVSKPCRAIDERVRSFLDRPLAGDWPWLRLDATHLGLREGGRIVPVAVIVAGAVDTDGRCEIIGPSAPRRRRCSGSRSCAAWSAAGRRASSASSPMPTRA